MKINLYVVCTLNLREETWVDSEGRERSRTVKEVGAPLAVTTDDLESRELRDLFEGDTTVTCLRADLHIGLSGIG